MAHEYPSDASLYTMAMWCNPGPPPELVARITVADDIVSGHAQTFVTTDMSLVRRLLNEMVQRRLRTCCESDNSPSLIQDHSDVVPSAPLRRAIITTHRDGT